MRRWLLAVILTLPAIAGCTQTTSSSAPAAALTGGTEPAVTPPAVTAPAVTAPVVTEPKVVPQGFETIGVTLREAGGVTRELCLWLAATSEQRGRGLMEVTDLGGKAGMLFQNDEPVTTHFYMLHTVMPLTVAFFDGAGQFVSSADMAPCPGEDCPTYAPAGPYVHAIEVPQGQLDDLGIGPGSAIVGRGACPA